MAHKIKDDEQQYQYTTGFTTPSGHEFHLYDTPDNERMVLKHSSGSHIEFKSDGSVIIKSLKDLHLHSSIVSSAGDAESKGDRTTIKNETNYTLDVTGELCIKCANLNIEVGETASMYAGTDFIVTSNHIVNKASESISLEGTKSIYMDTDEFKQRIVTQRSEIGTDEDKGKGGVNYMHLHGQSVIRNDDPNGGITISSAGYMNIVTGKERVDVTGQDIQAPSSLGKATFTNIVMPGKGALDKSGTPGDMYEQVTTNYTQEVGMERERKVGMNETVAIGGIQRITATKIFLN